MVSHEPWESNTGIEHSWDLVASSTCCHPDPNPVLVLVLPRVFLPGKHRRRNAQFPLCPREAAALLLGPIWCQLISLVAILIPLFYCLSLEVFPRPKFISPRLISAMATLSTIHPARQDSALSPNLHLNFFQHGLAISDLDFKDNRYPSLSLSSKSTNGPPMIFPAGDTHARDDPNPISSDTRKLPSAALDLSKSLAADPTNDTRTLNEKHDMSHPSDADGPLSPAAVSYAVPGNTRRTHQRPSLDDNINQSNGSPTPLLNGSNFVDSKTFNDSFKPFGDSLTQPLPSSSGGVRDISSSLYPATMRQSSYPLPDGAAISRLPSASGLSRPYSPTLAIPISSTPRVYPQHPTYITPAAATPDPINPILSPNPPQPQEEVCVECAMRDQDMADVVVVGPGIWDRESDVLFEELLRREEEEEAAGILHSECSTRLRARGGRLTEQNLKLWATMVSVLVYVLARYQHTMALDT